MTGYERPTPWTPPAAIPNRIRANGLLIRLYEPEDAESLHRAIDSSRFSLLPWLPWAATQHKDVAASRESIERFRASLSNPLAPENTDIGIVYGVFEHQTGELVGGSGFNRFNAPAHNAETGYWVRADRRRRGIATATLRAILGVGLRPQQHGGLGLRRMHIFAAACNKASCGVPDRLVLHRAQFTRQDRFVDGLGWCDTLGWDVLASEWDGVRGEMRA